MGLTHAPDPVHLGPGAGTAAAQSAVPRWYADPSGIGWTDTEPGQASGQLWAMTDSSTPLDWTFLSDVATGTIDFGDGSPTEPFSGGSTHTYPADGTYMATLTAGANTYSLKVKADSSAGRPMIGSMVPVTASIAAGPTTFTVEATGIQPGGVILLMGVPQVTTMVDATHFSFVWDPVANPSSVYLILRNPDGGATSGNNFSVGP